jgi:hypothetical protein
MEHLANVMDQTSGAQRFIWHGRRPQWSTHITKLGQDLLEQSQKYKQGQCCFKMGILPWGQSQGQGIRKIDRDMSSH